MTSTGTGDASGKVMNMSGSMADPMSGKMMTMRQRMTIADDNHHNFEMWAPAPDGKPYKMLEIEYSRRK